MATSPIIQKVQSSAASNFAPQAQHRAYPVPKPVVTSKIGTELFQLSNASAPSPSRDKNCEITTKIGSLDSQSSPKRECSRNRKDQITPKVGTVDAPSLSRNPAFQNGAISDSKYCETPQFIGSSSVLSSVRQVLFQHQELPESPAIIDRSVSRKREATPQLSAEQNEVLEQANALAQEAEMKKRQNLPSEAANLLLARVNLLKQTIPGSMQLATAYIDLATVREENGELIQAITCLERARPIHEQYLANSPELLKCYGQLAMLYESTYQIEKAFEVYTQSQKILGTAPIHARDLAAVRDKIADLLEAQGYGSRALALREINLPIYRESFPQTLKLAQYYDIVAAGSAEEAARIYLEASIQIEKTIPLGSPEMDAFCRSICKMYEDRSKLELIFGQISQGIDPSSKESLMSLSYIDLAGVRNSFVKMVERIRQFERILQKKAKLDPQNLCVSIFCECVADQYVAQENNGKASTFYRLALTTREATLGKDHENVVDLSKKIISWPSRLASMSRMRESQARQQSVFRAQSVAPSADKLGQLINDIGAYSSGRILKDSSKENAKSKLLRLLIEYQQSQDDVKYAEIAKYVNDELTKPGNNPIFAGAFTGNLSGLFVRTSVLFKVY